MFSRAPLVAQTVKNPPEMQETQVRSLGREDALEKGMATHSSILAWRIPWIEKLGGLESMVCKELDMTEQLSMLEDLRNSNPIRCSTETGFFGQIVLGNAATIPRLLEPSGFP